MEAPLSNEVAASLALALLKDNIARIGSLGARGMNRVKQELLTATGHAFEAYYSFASLKYGEAKTILYRHQPVPLYEFYVHVTLRQGRNEEVTTEHVSQPLLLRRHLIITGSAGSGKSTLLKHFFLDALNCKTYLPLMVELRQLNEQPDLGLIEFMRLALSKAHLALDESQFVRLLEGGRFLILLDAFDELNVSLAKRIEQEIIEFRDRFSENAVILSSRPDERFVGWSNFLELAVQPLTKESSLNLIERLRYDRDTKASFKKAVDEVLFDSHQSFLENPLLTTIMLMTFDQFGSIPEKMHLFYQQAFDTLYGKHDASKSGGYRREMYCDLAADDFQDILSTFCILTYLDSQYTFTRQDIIEHLNTVKKIVGSNANEFSSEAYLNDLLRSLCILLQDGLQYVFAHRTFQEYFAARYLVRANSAQRPALFEKVGDRIRRDAVIKLAWEMDRQVVETDFFIPALRAVRERSRYVEIGAEESLLHLMPQCFEAMQVDSESWGFMVGGWDSAVFPLELEWEVANLYRNSGEVSAVGSKKAIDELHTSIQKKYLAGKKKRPRHILITFSDNAHVPSNVLAVPLKTVVADGGLKAQMLAVAEPLLNHHRHAMQVLSELEEQAQAQHQSVRELLLMREAGSATREPHSPTQRLRRRGKRPQ